MAQKHLFKTSFMIQRHKEHRADEFDAKEDQSVGQHFQWHSNGQLFSLKNFKNGLESGEQKAWDQNGNLMYKYIYHDSKEVAEK